MKEEQSIIKEKWSYLARLLEVVFFGISLFLLIPSISPDIKAYYEFWPTGFLAFVFFTLNRIVIVLRKENSLTFALIYILFFVCFGYYIHQRVQY